MARCNAGLLVFAMVLGLLPTAGCNKGSGPGDTAASSANDAKSSAAPLVGGAATAHEVLEQMAAIYRKASTYEDFATADILVPGSSEPRRVDFKVAFERPNKLRMKCYQGEVVCDGKQWFGYSQDIPHQAVLREAPRQLKLHMLHADPVLDQALNPLASGWPQAVLLLEEKPLLTLLKGVRDQDLALNEQSGRIGDYDCYRVRFSREDGAGEYWIDQKTFVLRRMEFHQASVPPGPDGEPATEGLSIVANFERAHMDGAIDDPGAFKFAVPEGTQCHRALTDPGPFELVGKKLPDFQIADLQGKPWSSQALAGKVVALYLWRSNAESCLPVVPCLQQAYDKFKDNAKVAVFAISLDAAQVEAKKLGDTAKQWKLSAPILRDPNLETPKVFGLSVLPATFFLDAKGILQDCIVSDSPLAAAATTAKLEKLLAGEELATAALEKYQQRVQAYEKEVDLQFSEEAQTATVQQSKAAPPAARSAPKKLRLASLWKCTTIGSPGNILVIAPPAGKPRIYVTDGYKAIAEISLEGKALGTYKAKLADEEIFTLLRTAVGGDGKRYFAAFAPWYQRFHLFDENFKYLLSYPENALEYRNTGMADVELGDLNGDGVLKAYVGFGGTVGVKCVSLQGTRSGPAAVCWNVGRVLPGSADAQGHRDLFCVSEKNSLAILDATGHLRNSIKIPCNGILQYLVHADLAGSGQETWCGMIYAPDSQQLASGNFMAVGLNPKGQVTWKYDLPFGTQQAVEPIVVGRLLPGPARQWLLPAADGSIHVLAADGTAIDRFNYGAQVSGLATLEIGGKPVLLISSPGSLEALGVE